jgi:hypothetical protein
VFIAHGPTWQGRPAKVENVDRDRDGGKAGPPPRVMRPDEPELYAEPMQKRCRACKAMFDTVFCDQVTCEDCGALMEPPEMTERSLIGGSLPS